MKLKGVPILITDPVGEEGLSLLREAGCEIIQGEGRKPESYSAGLGRAAAWIVRSGTQVTRPLVEQAKVLKVVGRAGTGTDNIDKEACQERGIKVLNTPGANSLAAAELTLALMLASARNVPEADASLRRGEWRRAELAGTELGGKTLGIIGFGRIGRLVAERAKAFQMRVLAHDPWVKESEMRACGVEAADLDALLAAADYVTLHLPVSAESKHLLNAERIARMKRGARLINAARAGLVDEAALAAALTERRLAGAALDVWPIEPPGANPLLALPNVVVTPHLGASTAEAKQRVGLEVCQLIRDFLQEAPA
jgi:D-3-phosphoglycerate dehydrogenase